MMTLKEAINTGWGGLDQTETYGTTQHVTSIVGGMNPAVAIVRKQTEDEANQNIEDQTYHGLMGVTEAMENILPTEIPQSEYLSAVPYFAKTILTNMLVNNVFEGWTHTERQVMGPYIIDHIFSLEDQAVIVNIKENKGDSHDKWSISMTANDKHVSYTIKHQEKLVNILENLLKLKASVLTVMESVHAVEGPVNTTDPWHGSKIIHSEDNYELVSEIVENIMNEKFVSKAQARYFYWKAGKKGKEGKKWKKRAKEFSSKTNFSKLPDKVKKESKCDEPGECDNQEITLMDVLGC